MDVFKQFLSKKRKQQCKEVWWENPPHGEIFTYIFHHIKAGIMPIPNLFLFFHSLLVAK